MVTCAGVAGAPGRPGSLLAAVNYFGTVALLEGLRPHLVRSASPAAVAISSNSTTIQPAIPAALVAACLDGDEGRAHEGRRTRPGPVAAYAAAKLAIAHWVRRQAATGPSGPAAGSDSTPWPRAWSTPRWWRRAGHGAR